MLRRRDKAEKSVYSGKKNPVRDIRTSEMTDGGIVWDMLDQIVGNARVENDQISMSASRIRISQGRTKDHTRGMREEQLHQIDRMEKAQQQLIQLEKEIGRMRIAYEQEIACRQAQQNKVLELMEHSKHYTNLMKILQRPFPADEEGKAERQEKLQQLVVLLKENNIMLGNMAKALAGQQRQCEKEQPFCAQEQTVQLQQHMADTEGSCRVNLARQEAVLGEMETMEKCCGQQKESVERLEQLFEQMKRQMQGNE